MASLINVCMVVWVIATMNGTIQRTQSDTAELKVGINALTVQAANNSVRIGVLESKVDDIRDNQRRDAR